jgi:hypothetical protein
MHPRSILTFRVQVGVSAKMHPCLLSSPYVAVFGRPGTRFRRDLRCDLYGCDATWSLSLVKALRDVSLSITTKLLVNSTNGERLLWICSNIIVGFLLPSAHLFLSVARSRCLTVPNRQIGSVARFDFVEICFRRRATKTGPI